MNDALTPTSIVVVLNYKGREDTITCVESLLSANAGHAVLVVDNGSDDGVLSAVRERWPEVATLQNGANLGFAGGMNRGLSWALDRDFDVVTVLNNDTVVEPGALDRLVARARAGAVAASPVVRYRSRPGIWFAGGGTDERDGLPRHLTAAEAERLSSTVPPGEPYATELLAGCCVAASAATWTAVGTFDERFFLNFEDSEWSVRAGRAGVRLEVVPDAVVQHSVSASFTGAYSYLGTFYYARNILLFARSTRSGWVRTARMLRHHVLPLPVRAMRDAGLAEGLRRGVMVAAGLAMHGIRRYGRASGWVEAAARRWTGADRATPSPAGSVARHG